MLQNNEETVAILDNNQLIIVDENGQELSSTELDAELIYATVLTDDSSIAVVYRDKNQLEVRGLLSTI